MMKRFAAAIGLAIALALLPVLCCSLPAAEQTTATPASAQDAKQRRVSLQQDVNDKSVVDRPQQAEQDAAINADKAEVSSTPSYAKAAEQTGAISLGHPHAPGIMQLLEGEIRNGLQKRGIDSRFKQFERYLAWKLNSTAAEYTNYEVTGLCRLSWFDYLLRNPLSAPGEAEHFTRMLHSMCGNRQLVALVREAAQKLDVPLPEQFEPASTTTNSVDELKAALEQTYQCVETAIAGLFQSERKKLSDDLYRTFTKEAKHGHTLPNRAHARSLLQTIKKLDRPQLFLAALSLIGAANKDSLDALKKDAFARWEKHAASIKEPGELRALAIDTLAGKIIIAGPADDKHNLEELGSDVTCLIDLGGNDQYTGGQVNADRPLLLLIDFDGNDEYVGTKPGVQAGAILGLSMLIDCHGDDIYRARDLAQGSAIAGIGILIDYEGADRYVGIRRVQGQAIAGLGLLLDYDGNDIYWAAMWAQGLGGPWGFGLLDDTSGKDHYYLGGYFLDSYEETPGYEGWGQGLGNGLRQVANGGIGVLLDGGGDDTYEFDYLAHGGGYWLGLGFARDFGGNDQRLGATTRAFDGSARTQRRFQRFGTGFGCHYALGFCFDDAGNDSYGGTIMGLGFGWDCAVGVLCDFGGDDLYQATGGGTQGNAGQASLGILFDYKGNDDYRGSNQGYASPSITYHRLPSCGGNFAFLIDYGGDDKYGCKAKNNRYYVRGSSGGFLIDRPDQSEVEESNIR